jgi:hypothetical protein
MLTDPCVSPLVVTRVRTGLRNGARLHIKENEHSVETREMAFLDDSF